MVGGGRLFCVPCFYLLLKSDLRRNRTHAGTICDNSLKPGPQSRIAFFQVFQKSKQTWVPQPCPSGYMPEQVFIFLNAYSLYTTVYDVMTHPSTLQLTSTLKEKTYFLSRLTNQMNSSQSFLGNHSIPSKNITEITKLQSCFQVCTFDLLVAGSGSHSQNLMGCSTKNTLTERKKRS